MPHLSKLRRHVAPFPARSHPHVWKLWRTDDNLAVATRRISTGSGCPRATANAHPKWAPQLLPSDVRKWLANPRLKLVDRRDPKHFVCRTHPQLAKQQFFQPTFGRQNDSGLGASRCSACKCQWAASYLRAEVTHRNRFQNHAPKAA